MSFFRHEAASPVTSLMIGCKPSGNSTSTAKSLTAAEGATHAMGTMTWLEWSEFLSYAVTVVGLPFAIAVFMHDRRRARMNEQEEIYQRLADEYAGFLKLLLVNADLRLLRRRGEPDVLAEEQAERRMALFNILVSLFERAYMLVYEE